MLSLIVRGIVLALVVLVVVVTAAHHSRRRGRSGRPDELSDGMRLDWREGAMTDPRKRRDPDPGSPEPSTQNPERKPPTPGGA
jgi:hypothetical protein